MVAKSTECTRRTAVVSSNRVNMSEMMERSFVFDGHSAHSADHLFLVPSHGGLGHRRAEDVALVLRQGHHVTAPGTPRVGARNLSKRQSKRRLKVLREKPRPHRRLPPKGSVPEFSFASPEDNRDPASAPSEGIPRTDKRRGCSPLVATSHKPRLR